MWNEIAKQIRKSGCTDRVYDDRVDVVDVGEVIGYIEVRDGVVIWMRDGDPWGRFVTSMGDLGEAIEDARRDR